MSAQRTRGPWSVGEKPDQSALDMDQMVYCDDALGSRIADCSHRVTGHLITKDECIANAAFIVKCENHWDDLIEAASGVVENVKDPEPGGIPYLLVPRHNIEILKEILAKAGVS